MESRGVKEREPLEAGGIALAQRLRRRRGEIERALTRACANGEVGGVQDPALCRQIDAASAAVTEYYLACIEKGEDAWGLIPPAAIERARSSARSGIPLDDFLMEVIAAQALLNEFVLQESRDLTGDSLSGAQALQGSVLLHFASELAREYKQEEQRLRQSTSRRQNAFVERALSGAPVAKQEVGYSLEMWHIGLVVEGDCANDAARAVAESMGTAFLAVPRETETVWAWLGSHRRIPAQSVRDALDKRQGIEARFAVGEPGRNVEGWRATHFEARAAQAVAMRTSASVTCFSQVALEAIALQTPDLARSLCSTYLAPLAGDKRRGLVLRQTLRAYFDAERNASSAAISLRVSRRTVENRLRCIEQRLGRPLNACGAELELALRIEALGQG